MLSITGCKVGPEYCNPQTTMPDTWHQELFKSKTQDKAQLSCWWQYFNDSDLNYLIEQARQNNLNIKEAAERINQSRALVGVAVGSYYPQIDAIGDYSRSRASENGLTPLPAGKSKPDQTNLHTWGFDSIWELDVFGRISRNVESARASYEASIEDYRDVLVALYAEVARNYIDLRSIQSRIAFAQSNVEAQQKTLELTQVRFDADLIPKFDVYQATQNLANTESAIPTLKIFESQAIHRLSVLLGKPPAELFAKLSKPKPIPQPPDNITAGLPAELLRQRPDIRRSERELAAQNAQIGVATSELYPIFTLTGTFALQATSLNNAGDMGSRTYSFGPSVRWNIFDGDRIKNNIKFEEAKTKELYVRYERTVLEALEEVENSMVSYKQQLDRQTSLEKAVKATKKSVELVQERYINGLSDFQNVLDMERSLFEQQDQLAETQGAVLLSLTRLYKSLGGGWTDADTDFLARNINCSSK